MREMVNIRRVNSERCPKSFGSPKTEVGEIDTRAPFQSVKAAVSLFGEVVVSKERRTPRKSRLSTENVIDRETQLLLAQIEYNNIKQKLDSAEATKAKAVNDLETAKATLHDLSSRLKAATQSKQYAVEARDAMKEQAMKLDLQMSKTNQESNAQREELYSAIEQYADVSAQLDVLKQELNKVRQDFDAALEVKLAAFQQAAEAQCAAKVHDERVTELTKEIAAKKNTIQQVKFATQQAYQEQANILEEKDALQITYRSAKKEAETKLVALRKTYDPELTKQLEDKLMETTMEVEALKEEMKKAHALEMDSVRVVTAELNEATATLQQVADEECALRNIVCSLRLAIEEVKREQEAEIMKQKHAAEVNEKYFSFPPLIENADDIEEMKQNAQRLKREAETVKRAAEELKQKLDSALEEAREAKAAEKMALEEMQVLSSKENMDNLEPARRIKIPKEEYESLKRKANASENIAETKLAAAMAELEEINARKTETDKKLEASLKAVEEIKAATDLAEKSASSAEAAHSMIESELNRRRQEEQIIEL